VGGTTCLYACLHLAIVIHSYITGQDYLRCGHMREEETYLQPRLCLPASAASCPPSAYHCRLPLLITCFGCGEQRLHYQHSLPTYSTSQTHVITPAPAPHTSCLLTLPRTALSRWDVPAHLTCPVSHTSCCSLCIPHLLYGGGGGGSVDRTWAQVYLHCTTTLCLLTLLSCY